MSDLTDTLPEYYLYLDDDDFQKVIEGLEELGHEYLAEELGGRVV